MGSRKLNQVVVLLCSLVAVLRFTTGEVTDHITQELSTIVMHIGAERSLVEGKNDSVNTSSAGTKRIESLDYIKKYEGGHDITKKHYWNSIMFTGKYGYIVAGLWFLGGLIYAGILLTNKSSREKRQFNYSNENSFRFILPSIILTIIAIVSSGVVLGGSLGFDSRAQSIKNIIADTAEEASVTLKNVAKNIGVVKNITQLYDDLGSTSSLDDTLRKLNDEADSIRGATLKRMRMVNKGIKTLKVMIIISIVLNLIAIVAFFASRSLQLDRAIHLLIILCWLLTFLLWLYFGIFYALDKVADDTCVALDEYRSNPENSPLSSILPSPGQFPVNTVLHDVGAGIYNIIDQVNTKISQLKSSGHQGIAYVCNPFSGAPAYDFQPEKCSSDTIKIGDLPEILKKYTCTQNDGITCIPASYYNKVIVHATSIQNIINAFPSMKKLVDFQIVKDAFSEILIDQCKSLKKNAYLTWTTLAALSTVMVFLILFWIYFLNFLTEED